METKIVEFTDGQKNYYKIRKRLLGKWTEQIFKKPNSTEMICVVDDKKIRVISKN